MKTLLTISTLVFTVMFSSTSFGGWTKVGSGTTYGSAFYLDLERIRKVDGYIYFWMLIDLKEPVQRYLSIQYYKKGDCRVFRSKNMSSTYYPRRMGKGTGETFNAPEQWTYPKPGTSYEGVLKAVCSR